MTRVPHRPATPQGAPGRAALAEFAAICADVAINLPGERPASWWASVREAVCAHHGVTSLQDVGTGRSHNAA